MPEAEAARIEVAGDHQTLAQGGTAGPLAPSFSPAAPGTLPQPPSATMRRYSSIACSVAASVRGDSSGVVERVDPQARIRI